MNYSRVARRYLALLALAVVVQSVLIQKSSIGSGASIDHIIVLFQENRAFDHYFGTYTGANGLSANISLPIAAGSDVRVRPFHLPYTNLSSAEVQDLSHTPFVARIAYNNGSMDGFIYAEGSNLTMGYYDYRDIPYYWDYASKYVLMDNFFSSEMGPSLPNHMYLIAGQSDDIYGNLNQDKMDNLTLNAPTITDELDNRGISWKYYYDASNYTTPGLWNPLPTFVSFRSNSSKLNNLAPNDQFLTDLANGHLGSVSWVMPLGGKSEHPPNDVVVGEHYIVSLVNAIMNSSYWSSTAIFITWDDYGGWYDHVPPPQLDSFGLGFRVPCLVISPYAKEGFIDHTQSDFCSILKFIEARYSIPPLTQRDATTNDMLEAFNFSQTPRKPLILPGPYVPDHYPLIRAEPDVAISDVVPEKTVVGQGLNVKINVTVANIGNSTESFNITTYANTTSIGTQQLTLPSGNSTTITFAWNTTSFAKGNYTIRAYAWPVPGETNTADNTYTYGLVLVTIIGDINGNGIVNVQDAIDLSNSFGLKTGQTGFNPNADFDDNGVINILDAIILANHFNQHYP